MSGLAKGIPGVVISAGSDITMGASSQNPVQNTICDKWTGLRNHVDSWFYCQMNPGDPEETSWTSLNYVDDSSAGDVISAYANVYYVPSFNKIAMDFVPLQCPGTFP